ncbi:glycosyltransferase family 25 protein [Yoonia sp.]|uniref:glycosyltransferase family 25 protein n=1 Tax=Yoonia sp. TaxID=2212373 RepID=UPI003975632F
MSPPVLILSLEDATERRAPLINAFETRNVPYEIWHAIDGRNGLPPEYESMIDRPAARLYLGREMGNAEFACALSHHFIYREILTRGFEMAVILEDDAIVDEAFFGFIKTVQMPACDLLLLDHYRALVRRTDRLKLDKNKIAYRCMSTPWLTTGYIITRDGAQKLVDQSLPITEPADWPTDLSEMQAYALAPRLVDHPDMKSAKSDIRQDREPCRPRASRRKRRSSRRFLRLSYWRKTYHKRLGKWVS